MIEGRILVSLWEWRVTNDKSTQWQRETEHMLLCSALVCVRKPATVILKIKVANHIDQGGSESDDTRAVYHIHTWIPTWQFHWTYASQSSCLGFHTLLPCNQLITIHLIITWLGKERSKKTILWACTINHQTTVIHSISSASFEDRTQGLKTFKINLESLRKLFYPILSILRK